VYFPIYFTRVIVCSLKNAVIYLIKNCIYKVTYSVYLSLLNSRTFYLHLEGLFVCLHYACSCPWFFVKIIYIFHFLYATGGFITNNSYFHTLRRISWNGIKENIVSMFTVITYTQLKGIMRNMVISKYFLLHNSKHIIYIIILILYLYIYSHIIYNVEYIQLHNIILQAVGHLQYNVPLYGSLIFLKRNLLSFGPLLLSVPFFTAHKNN
jgi:hypothetical protein